MIHRLCWTSLIGIVLLQCHHYVDHWTDDAFIFFRYAENVAAGLGPVWNSVGVPVEGFSSPLWLGLLALGIGFGLTPMQASIGYGFLSVAGLLVLQWRISSMFTGPWLSFLSTVLLGLMGAVYYWAFSGMETILFALLFLCSIRALLDGKGWWLAAAMSLARPEGPLLLVLWIACFAQRFPKNRGRAALTAIPIALYVGFRLYFYGEWLPNTYYAKVGAPMLERIAAGSLYAQSLLLSIVPILFWAVRDKRPQIRVLLAAVLIELAIVLFGGGDWMMWGRMLIPIFAPLIVLCVLALHARWYWAVLSLVALTPFFNGLSAWKHIVRGERLPVKWHQEGSLKEVSETIAEDLRHLLPADGLVAINHAGFLPYYLKEYAFVDMTGLNDYHIAHQVEGGLHQKFDSDYVLAQEPDVIVLNSHRRPERNSIWFDYWDGETNLARHPAFQKNYQLSKVYSRLLIREGEAFVLIFVRQSDADEHSEEI